MSIVDYQPYTSTLASYQKYFKTGADVFNKYANWRIRKGVKSTLDRKLGPVGEMPTVGSKRKLPMSHGSRPRRRRARYTAPYGGIRSVPRPKPVKKMSKVALYGCRHEREIWGKNTMASCNYTGFMSMLPKVAAYDLGIAFIRWLMRKHYQVQYTNVNDKLMGSFSSGAEDGPPPLAPLQIRFYFTERNTNNGSSLPNTSILGTFSTFNAVTSAADTSKTVAEFGEWFRDTMLTKASTAEVSHYTLWHRQIAANSTMVLTESQRYPISELRCHVYSKISYYIQNQTTTDGNTMDTDRIDTNPVHGKMMFFRGLMPRIRDPQRSLAGGQLNSDIDRYDALVRGDLAQTDNNGLGDGVIIPNANPTGVWRAPPAADQFRNCYRERNIRVDPGEIRRGVLRYDFKGRFSYLIDQMAFHVGSGTGPVGDPVPLRPLGNCVLFALEKVLRTGSSRDVSLTWHIDRYTGARITGNRLVPMAKHYTQEPGTVDWNNDPA